MAVLSIFQSCLFKKVKNYFLYKTIWKDLFYIYMQIILSYTRYHSAPKLISRLDCLFSSGKSGTEDKDGVLRREGIGTSHGCGVHENPAPSHPYRLFAFALACEQVNAKSNRRVAWKISLPRPCWLAPLADFSLLFFRPIPHEEVHEDKHSSDPKWKGLLQAVNWQAVVMLFH